MFYNLWTGDSSSADFDWRFAQNADQVAPGILDVVNAIRVSGESVIDAVARARAQLAMTDAQSDLLRINIERARAGQTPLSPQQYTSGAQTQGVSSSTVWLGLLGIGALILATRR